MHFISYIILPFQPKNFKEKFRRKRAIHREIFMSSTLPSGLSHDMLMKPLLDP